MSEYLTLEDLREKNMQIKEAQDNLNKHREKGKTYVKMFNGTLDAYKIKKQLEYKDKFSEALTINNFDKEHPKHIEELISLSEKENNMITNINWLYRDFEILLASYKRDTERLKMSL